MQQTDLIKIYRQKRCLVVDDFSEVRGSISRTLKVFGVENVDTTPTGEDAVALCQNKHYDIVFPQSCGSQFEPGSGYPGGVQRPWWRGSVPPCAASAWAA